MFITSPEKFTALFNEKYPGAHRRITVNDVVDMTKFNLIGRHDYYLHEDLELVRRLLQYEKMRQTVSTQPSTKDELLPPSCKLCGQILTEQLERKSGRPKEFCPRCESSRSKVRGREFRKRKKRSVNQSAVSLRKGDKK